MTDYTKFDDALLTEIRASAQSFTQLTMMRHLRTLSDSLKAISSSGRPVDTDRVFDRRLQALRKRGLIRFNAGRWEAV